jgi:hypothetical protein
MSSRSILSVRRWRWSALVMLAALAGCSRQQSVESRIQIALANDGLQKTAFYPLAGTVTIDGQPPHFKNRRERLLIVLHNPERPDFPGFRTVVGPDGKFQFSKEGLASGHYVVLFAALHGKGQGSYGGPDGLNNLYNDPDVNAKKEAFVIDHKAPGKEDYDWNLEVAGKEKAAPGPHALTKLK